MNESVPSLTPPQDIDAEKAVLGSLIIDNEVLPDVASIVTRLGFWRDDSPRWLAREYHQHRASPEDALHGAHTVVLIPPAD